MVLDYRSAIISPIGNLVAKWSERDVVVAVDQLGVFGLGRLRAAQEVDLLGDDLAAVAVVPRMRGEPVPEPVTLPIGNRPVVTAVIEP